MGELAKMSPKLNWDDLTQMAALPLGSWIKTDPWDDKVHQLNAKIYAPMNARDKMPFEVTPIFYKLQRYDVAKMEAPAAPIAVPAGPAAPATPAAGTEPAAQPPAATPDTTPQSPPPPTAQSAAGDAAAAQQQPPAQTSTNQ
jgi:hypothetical protein